MELRHLRYFVAVAEEENVSRAALRLHVSQPGVSRQIRDLEEEIGFALLERSAKSVRLTAAGKCFLSEARAVLRRAAEAVERARAAAGDADTEMNVGYAPSLTVDLLPRTLRRFRERFPKVRVILHDLSTGEMVARLRGGRLQVALAPRLSSKEMAGLDFEELARYPLCLAVPLSHPLAKAKFVSLAQVAREPLIGFSRKEYPEYHAGLEKLFAAVGHRPKITGDHEGVTSLAAAVEAGHGLAFVPGCVACLVGDRLRLLPLRPPPPPISVVALWRRGASGEGGVREFVAAAKVGRSVGRGGWTANAVPITIDPCHSSISSIHGT